MQFLGVDTGGTFTDFVFFDGDHYKIHKVLSTPSDPSVAIHSGTSFFENIKLKSVVLIHGTTVATNALLERKGAEVLLLTTSGFEDVIEIGRQNRDKLYDLFWQKRPPLVSSKNRIGVSERIDSNGTVLKNLNIDEIQKLLDDLDLESIETIAISYINSYINPEHEIKTEEILTSLNLPISISSRIIPEFREYERTSTTVANSYLIPKVKYYMKSLSEKLEGTDIYVMQSNGGVIRPERAGVEPVRIITSGPAGGVVGAFKISQQAGIEKIITYDMGGTSTDISLCDGSLRFTTESVIDGIPIKIPMVNIFTIGAGGGSIAYADSGGALKVGPQSAGADPGPACYGKGNEPTVTDANLLLGRIQADCFLGGRMKVDAELARVSIDRLCDKFGTDHLKLAEMIIKIANSNMERAIKVISVDKGYDPREFSLVSFGGAGGLHACELARDIGIKRIIFPINPGVLSALGMLFADSFKDYSKGFFLDFSNTDFITIEEQYNELEKRAIAEFQDEDIEFERLIDVRYKRQSHELTVPYSDNFVNDFHNLHNLRYGFKDIENVVEIVTVRIRAIINRSTLALPELGIMKSEIRQNKTKIFTDNNQIEVDYFSRKEFYAGFVFNGPSIITEDTSTLFIPEGYRCEVDQYGNIISEQKY